MLQDAGELQLAQPLLKFSLDRKCAVPPATRSPPHLQRSCAPQVLGADHPHALRSAVYYSNLLVKMGNHQEALACYMLHLSRQQRVLGSDHPDVLSCCHNIGFCLLQLDRTQEAAQYLSDCLQLRRRVLGEGHAEVDRTSEVLARALEADRQKTAHAVCPQ